ncbi:cobyrinate a,c-diamide synthase [Mesobaculum littorinae]|uniref:Hydrogenobyrinate a,c-diamide synthase n=1 Tax=Mesobaculum littorinae TaxID=2486419 RepID=A0A438AM90_9RHOB|nr:cobyrinate a,c-diamide synthase [Mesobaculum littorinae]RVV99868.1 cobyrinate a,c-diamide synthase [Mesobaculum littorinae]
MPGLILSAPASGSGKTTVTLGLLRAFAQSGAEVRGAKSGPDYIDPRFHEAACGRPCPNLDAWAMGSAQIRALAAGPGLLLIEGAMGLFDGAPPDGRGATADLARQLSLPVVLVIDAGRMAQSVAPLAAGFARHDPQVRVAGVILNRVGSDKHAAMLRSALSGVGLPVLGELRRDAGLAHPSRHLGLVQAGERPDLDAFLDRAARAVTAGVDLAALTELAGPMPDLGSAHSAPTSGPTAGPTPPPPAQTIALAQDGAFAFAYPHHLAEWHAAGAEIRPFSPLADDLVPEADLTLLPGGYPELHAPRLAAATTFLSSLRHVAARGAVYGECGGYMVLGKALIDAEGRRHQMAGLLPLVTSFERRRLSLGYRRVTAASGPMPGVWRAHEFHYATEVEARGAPLFTAQDAEGTALPPMGLIQDRVAGSFAHLIARDTGDLPFPEAGN